MMPRRFVVSIAIAATLLGLVAPAGADWQARDGNGNPLTFKSYGLGGGQQLQQVLPSDISGNPYSQSNPQYFDLLLNGILLSVGQNVKANSLPVAPPSDPDVRPSPVSLTAADNASSTATGQNGSSIVTGSPTANSAFQLAVNGVSNASLQLSGTWVATAAFEISIDGGTTFGPMLCHVRGATQFPDSIISASANGIVDCDAAGATHIRVRLTAFTSGAVVVTATASAAPGAIKVINKLATAPLGVTSSDDSGTITTGGSYQTAIAASSNRKGCTIQNPSSATEALNVKFGTMAQPFVLAAGSFIDCNHGGIVLQDAITVMGATTGHAFAAIAQ